MTRTRLQHFPPTTSTPTRLTDSLFQSFRNIVTKSSTCLSAMPEDAPNKPFYCPPTFNSPSCTCESQSKPSYPQLIFEAISSAENKQLTLKEIFSYKELRYPNYIKEKTSWQKRIRHNLLLKKPKYFLKVSRR